MIKKAVVLLAPIAVIVALALMPITASADCKYQPGTPHTPAYCIKFCKVPKVKGKSLKRAKQLIRRHDCRVGKIKRKERDKDRRGSRQKDRKEKKKKERLVVRKQSPKPGTSWPAGKKVNLRVKG